MNDDNTLVTDGGAVERTEEHPDLGDLERDQTVRVAVDDDVVVGEVDDIRHSGDGEVLGHAVTVDERGFNGRVIDVETQFDPRNGWNDLVASERLYTGEPPTKFVELGPAEIDPVDLGVDPDQLDPGRDVEMPDGDHYRIVVPPWERRFDSKALAYNLETTSNLVEKINPAEVIRLVR